MRGMMRMMKMGQKQQCKLVSGNVPCILSDGWMSGHNRNYHMSYLNPATQCTQCLWLTHPYLPPPSLLCSPQIIPCFFRFLCYHAIIVSYRSTLFSFLLFCFLSGHVVEMLRPRTRKEREGREEVIGMNGPAVQSQVVCGYQNSLNRGLFLILPITATCWTS